MVNRPAAPTGASQSSAAAESEVLKQKKANETQQAVVLFIIVLASTTRVFLLAWLFREKFWDILCTSSLSIIGDGGGIRFRCLRERIIESTIPFEKILV